MLGRGSACWEVVVYGHVVLWALGEVATTFDLACDPDHRFGGEEWVASDRGLAGEHDGVGPIEDGVGNIASLGAGWARRLDHRLEHLGRGDDWSTEEVREADDPLLGYGHLFEGYLDAEVTARDHDGIGLGEDLVDIVEGGILLDLGDDQWSLGYTTTQIPDILCALDEGEGDIVCLGLDEEVEVIEVLLGEGGCTDPDAGEVDPLVRGEGPAADHRADDARWL